MVSGEIVSTHASFDAANRRVEDEARKLGINPYDATLICGAEPITAAAVRYCDRIGQIDAKDNVRMLREDTDATPVNIGLNRAKAASAARRFFG